MNKVTNIETLRGIAILLVVMGHVIGSAPDGGMRIDFPSPWRYLYLWIDYIQMPLFTAIAGWVYALKPININFKKFAEKKAVRLLIPMAVVGTLYFLIQYFTPGTNGKGNLLNMWRIYIFPYTIYWYLPSLFLIFLMMFGIDKYKLCKTSGKWLQLILITWGLYILTRTNILADIPNILSFKGALGQLPYFIIGVGINRFKDQLYTHRTKILYSILACTGLILLQFKWFFPIGRDLWYTSLLPVWVSAGLMILLHQKYSNRFLVWLGGYAYTIYLLHGFGTSGGRIILTHLHIQSEGLIFLFSTTIALLCPILADIIASKWKITRIMLLGKK